MPTGMRVRRCAATVRPFNLDIKVGSKVEPGHHSCKRRLFGHEHEEKSDYLTFSVREGFLIPSLFCPRRGFLDYEVNGSYFEGVLMKDSLKQFLQMNRLELIVLPVALVLALLSGLIYFHPGITEQQERNALSGEKKETAGKEKAALLGRMNAGKGNAEDPGILTGVPNEPEGSGQPQTLAPSFEGKENKGYEQGTSNKQLTNNGQSAPSPAPSSPNNTDSDSGDQNPPPPAVTNEPEEKVNVALTIDNGARKLEFLIKADKNSSVFHLLKRASSEFGFSFGYSNDSAYGVFVEELDGVRNNPSAGKYWVYYLNGKYASLGASSQKISEGDVISWCYENSH